MAKHIFYIPASYAAIIYTMLSAGGLLLCLYVGLVKHSEELLINNCGPDHHEFWPSISSAIGDFQPERQIWRIAFILCCPFRLGASITMFTVFWQKSCRGMQDVYAFLPSLRKFIGSSAFLTLLMLWSDLFRLIGAVVWTMVSSMDHFPYHNLGFGPYIAFGFILQIATNILVRRNLYNLNIYESQRDAHISLRMKRFFTLFQTLGALGVVFWNTYHKITCYDNTYSMATMSEWVFAISNVLYDATAWYELKKEGWWLSGSPEFYLALFGSVTGARPVTGNVNEPTSAIARSSMAAGQKDELVEAGQTAQEAVDDRPGGLAGPGSANMRARNDMDNANSNGNNNAAAEVRVPMRLSSSAEANAPMPLPPSSTGEFFLSHDVILHRFTFCSAPSRIHLWLCDIYWSHLLFEMMVHLVQHMYFMPLIAMSLSWEIIVVMVFGAPCLLRIGVFRRWATGPCVMARTLLKPSHMPTGKQYRTVPMYVLFYFVASFSHLHLLIQRSDRHKILGVAVGPLFLLLGVVTRYLYPSTASLKSTAALNNEDSRRMLYAFPMGLVLGMLERICYLSVAPMFVEPVYAGVFGIALGIAFTLTIYRHSMFGNAVKENPSFAGQDGGAAGDMAGDMMAGGPILIDTVDDSDEGNANAGDDDVGDRKRRVQFTQEGEEEAASNTIVALAMSYPQQNSYYLGFLMGLITSLSLTFFTCANYIPRLLAVEPYPASLLVVLFFAAGLFYSTDVAPICAPILSARGRSAGGPIVRLLRFVFRQSWARMGIILYACTVVMLFATRQTNFTYEKPSKDYPVSYETPEERVVIANWGVQEGFSGNKYIAFAGGLGFTFCIGVIYPVVMELCLAHQHVRRMARLADSVDVEQVFRREPSMLTSFEASWFTWTIVPSAIYALCISYPFVPMAWLVREQSRLLIQVHVMTLFMATWVVVRKMRNAKSTIVPSIATARKQRSLQRFIVLLIAVGMVSVILGRAVLYPGDVSFPAGKDTAIKYQDEVLRVHEMLIDLRVKRNVVTDVLMTPHEVTYHRENFDYLMAAMEHNITAADSAMVDPKYGLGHLSQEVRTDVWNAAKAMTFFSGLIWTVHFALDNFNVDSLDRMVLHAKDTEAGIIGLLESDSMHVTNGNRDMVEHMSYYTGFRYTDYGPTALDNTYGCAMISRYPIVSVHRYVMPSPLGELACMIHAVLDVYGLHVHTYVAHFGNTEHFADGLLQSQFLGRVVQANPGPSLWLGYLVTFPGNPKKYHEYTSPTERGKFRDTALETYMRRPWVRLIERGGYEEEPPLTITQSPDEPLDFNVEAKLNTTYHLEASRGSLDRSFRRTPPGKALRHFYFNQTNRYATAHPRFEFIDRYCQYNLYKTGAAKDELPQFADKLQPYQADMFDWWRKVDGGVEDMSDTEIQVTQLRFFKRTE